MEKYRGVKFSCRRIGDSFPIDRRLATLNHWAYLFCQLGLTPTHADGAYGNQSFRTGPTSFVITRSGMTPAEQVTAENYSHVAGFEPSANTFLIEGQAIPSSESLLHNALYKVLPDIHAILHGHSQLLNSYADALGIPVTREFFPYGTAELAESAVELMDGTLHFFILKDHGFVALGENIDAAGKLTLDYYAELIRIIRTY